MPSEDSESFVTTDEDLNVTRRVDIEKPDGLNTNKSITLQPSLGNAPESGNELFTLDYRAAQTCAKPKFVEARLTASYR